MKQLLVAFSFVFLFLAIITATTSAAAYTPTHYLVDIDSIESVTPWSLDGDPNGTCSELSDTSFQSSGTIEIDEIREGCIVDVGEQPTTTITVVGIRFVLTTYSFPQLGGVYRYSSIDGNSLVNSTTTITPATPHMVCSTVLGTVQADLTAAGIGCDTYTTNFQRSVTKDNFLSFIARGDDSADVEFNVVIEDIQWIYYGELPPTPTPSPTPTGTPGGGGGGGGGDGTIIGVGGDIGLPVPDTGLEIECYECPSPQHWYNVGMWVAKLICIVKNLFTCLLRIWLLEIANWLNGLFDFVGVIINWFVGLFTGAIGWFISLLGVVVNWVANIWSYFVDGIKTFFYSLVVRILESPVVQFIANLGMIAESIFNLLSTGFRAFIRVIYDLYDGLIDLLELIYTFVLAVWEAIATETIAFTSEAGTGEINTGALSAEGYNDSKLIYLVLLAMGATDFALGQVGIDKLQILFIGSISFGLIAWTFEKWKEILPI